MSRFVGSSHLTVELLNQATVTPEQEPVRLKSGKLLRPKVTPVQVYQIRANGVRLPVQIVRNAGLYSVRTEVEQVANYPVNRVKLRNHQEETLKLCLAKLKQYSTLLIKFPPGYGKTIMSMTLWRFIRMRVVVLINRTTLVSSWKNTVHLCFGDTDPSKRPVSVWVVGEDQPPVDSLPDVIICMVQRVDQIPPSVQEQIGMVIVDEGHLFCTASHVHALTLFQPNFVLVATATPYRDNGMEKMLDMFVHPESWVRIGSRRPYFVNVVHTDINLDSLCIQSGSEATFGNKYSLAHQCPERNQLILDLIGQAYRSGKKCMVLSTTTDHIDTLSQGVPQIDSKITFSCYYKSIKNCGNYDVLLGTVPKVGTGFDEAMTCRDFDGIKSNVLILCTSVKSVGLFEQLIGRVMRSEAPHIVILMDDDRLPQNHLRGLESYIESSNGVIQHFFVNKMKIQKNLFRNMSPQDKLAILGDRSIRIDFTRARPMSGPEYIYE